MVSFTHTNGLTFGNVIETPRGGMTLTDEELSQLKRILDIYFDPNSKKA